MSDLQVRLERVSRGRPVSVTVDPMDVVFAPDYNVSFQEDSNSFEVVLRRGGCFEGAYRCVERFIEAQSELLDGIDTVPHDFVDLRSHMQYWILESFYEQFRTDLQAAISRQAADLRTTGHGNASSALVSIPARVDTLNALEAFLAPADKEIRHGVLSPRTVELLNALGLLSPKPPA